jgi:hypothetical protein
VWQLILKTVAVVENTNTDLSNLSPSPNDPTNPTRSTNPNIIRAKNHIGVVIEE